MTRSLFIFILFVSILFFAFLCKAINYAKWMDDEALGKHRAQKSQIQKVK